MILVDLELLSELFAGLEHLSVSYVLIFHWTRNFHFEIRDLDDLMAISIR